MSNVFDELLSSTAMYEIMSVEMYIVCILSALIMGVLLSYGIQYGNKISKSFAITLALLPAVVCVIIMMVNGSIGTGIAVAGAFSLVRFRSVPGNAKEITGIFIAMAIGLACGMGNVVYGLIFTVIVLLALLILESTRFGETKVVSQNKMLKITLAEDVDYTTVFSDIFENYTEFYHLITVKSINLGSMFRVTYDVVLKDASKEKAFIDQLRVRNSNLEITLSSIPVVTTDL